MVESVSEDGDEGAPGARYVAFRRRRATNKRVFVKGEPVLKDEKGEPRKSFRYRLPMRCVRRLEFKVAPVLKLFLKKPAKNGTERRQYVWAHNITFDKEVVRHYEAIARACLRNKTYKYWNVLTMHRMVHRPRRGPEVNRSALKIVNGFVPDERAAQLVFKDIFKRV